MSDTQLPPVGSLWLHRETGERRFVTRHGWESPFVGGRYATLSVSRTGRMSVDDKYGNWADVVIPLSDWLTWAAGAERIDRAEA